MSFLLLPEIITFNIIKHTALIATVSLTKCIAPIEDIGTISGNIPINCPLQCPLAHSPVSTEPC